MRRLVLAVCAATLPILAAAQTPSYEAVIGNDWRAYQSTAELRQRVRFFWFDKSRNPNDFVELVPDRTFERVARITQPQDNNPQTRGGASPELRVMLPAPLENVWFRFRVRFSPGWTTAGPYPAGWANSYKLAFILWKDRDGRAQIEFSNTRQYILGAYVNNGGCSDRPLPGSQSFGNVTTEWTDGEWWEFVMHYERTSPRTFEQHWWRRRLTNGGAIVSGPFVHVGRSVQCQEAPAVRGIALGANKNKASPSTQYIHWGPWEVVDGSRYPDPFALPGGR